MEMEFFVPPADADEWHRYWIEQRVNWHHNLGLRPSHLRVRAHSADELSHYSSATSDLEYLFPIGWQELEGVANRGDYDLRQHSEASGTTLEWIGHEERYVPYVIEPAIGVGRAFLAFMCDAYDEEVVAERPRTLLRLHPRLAPVKVAVLPLVGKDTALVEKARPLYEELRRSMSAEYDDSAAIGKRYRRQDEIGTPWALTIDEQTVADGTITLRDRDTLEQERIPIDGAKQLLLDRLERPGALAPNGLAATDVHVGGAAREPARRSARAPAARLRAGRHVPALPVRVRDPGHDGDGGRLVQRRAVEPVVSGPDLGARAGRGRRPGRRRSPRSAARSTSTRPGSATTTRISATSSSRTSTRTSRRCPRLGTAASRASRPAATAR